MHYTPERVMQIERNLGADVIMQLDELIAGGAEDAASRAAMERSLRWLGRCRVEFERLGREGRAPLPSTLTANGAHRATSLPLTTSAGRRRSRSSRSCRAASTRNFAAPRCAASCDTGAWDGIAIGGLSVGESKPDLYATLEVCDPDLPRDRPRYLMGVGFPDDLLEAVQRGMDLFDCVAPTRMGRHGTVFTREGTVQIRKSSFRTDRRPLDEACACPACTDYDRAYLRHLFAAEEPLGPRLLALHNLAFLLRLMRDARERLADGTFTGWSTSWLERYRERGRLRRE